MIIKGRLIDMTTRTISPRAGGKQFTPFDQITLLVKEDPQRNPEKVTCSPEQLNGAEIGKVVELPVYVKGYSNGGRFGYELRVSS